MRNSFYIFGLLFLISTGLSKKIFSAPLDFDFTSQIPTNKYEDLVRPLVSLTRFQFMSPPSTLVSDLIPIGFSIGAGASYANVPTSEKQAAQQYIGNGNDFPSYFIVPRVVAHLSLPMGLDLAANYASVPSSSISLLGFGAQYSFLGPSDTFSLAIRAGYDQILGFPALSANSVNGELVGGIPLFFLEPYAGVGYSRSSANSSIRFTSNGTTVSANPSATWAELYAILGVRLTVIPLIAFNFDAQFADEQTQFNAQVMFHL